MARWVIHCIVLIGSGECSDIQLGRHLMYGTTREIDAYRTIYYSPGLYTHILNKFIILRHSPHHKVAQLAHMSGQINNNAECPSGISPNTSSELGQIDSATHAHPSRVTTTSQNTVYALKLFGRTIVSVSTVRTNDSASV